MKELGGFDKIHARRLTQLADHMEHGELGHQFFDFSTYNNSAGPYCGTRGCAVGECPILWPNDWEFDFFGTPVMNGQRDSIDGQSLWFGMTLLEAELLFSEECRGLRRLATKEEIAGDIRAFLEKKAAEVG